MIKIFNEVVKKQENFWSAFLFHPTDAVEDSWGKRILDKVGEDKCAHTVRVYPMLEDIVYLDENDELCYDFRANDLRLDYLLEKGFDLVLAYAGMPDCIAKTNLGKRSNSKNKTRYKGKLWNTSPPKTPELWEEVCYQYTKHLVERYGEETLSRWYCHCFNEPDVPSFFMSDTPYEAEERYEEYFSMYCSFVKGVRRATKVLPVGGPALACRVEFLKDFLLRVKNSGVEMNYISIHFYGTDPTWLNCDDPKLNPLSVNLHMESKQPTLDVIKECGFENTPILLDEWGASTMGFFNKDECSVLMFRETEINSSYYVRLLSRLIESDLPIKKLMICLSGQHEMTEDFSGFRNFFTLNFIRKPIYNAYVLASKLGETVVKHDNTDPCISIIPTKTATGGYAVLLCYAAENFLKDAPDKTEEFVFDEDLKGKTVTIWAIDKTHTNPYRVYQSWGEGELTNEQIKLLREEGKLKPVYVGKAEDKITLSLTAGATFFISVE